MRAWFQFALYACLGGGFAVRLSAGEPSSFQLRPAIQVSGEGIFLNELIAPGTNFPAVRLGEAPALGKTIVLTRSQIADLARPAGLDFAATNWTGADTVRVGRRTRSLAEAEALHLLTAALQEGFVKDKGELELRFSRPWAALAVPDEALTLKVIDLPSQGVTPAFIARFELETPRGERLGSWQAALQAKVWREIWVAHSGLKRGDSLRGADVARERRDVLVCHDNVADFQPEDSTLEIAEPVTAGMPVLARSLRARPVVHRGQNVDAVLQEGALAITLKVEALEDGTPGQVIRLRNPLSRRDLRGKVLDHQNVLVSL